MRRIRLAGQLAEPISHHPDGVEADEVPVRLGDERGRHLLLRRDA
jgi:hypothetical protein